MYEINVVLSFWSILIKRLTKFSLKEACRFGCIDLNERCMCMIIESFLPCACLTVRHDKETSCFIIVSKDFIKNEVYVLLRFGIRRITDEIITSQYVLLSEHVGGS